MASASVAIALLIVGIDAYPGMGQLAALDHATKATDKPPSQDAGSCKRCVCQIKESESCVGKEVTVKQMNKCVTAGACGILREAYELSFKAALAFDVSCTACAEEKKKDPKKCVAAYKCVDEDHLLAVEEKMEQAAKKKKAFEEWKNDKSPTGGVESTKEDKEGKRPKCATCIVNAVSKGGANVEDARAFCKQCG
jgi:hypothetical protein